MELCIGDKMNLFRELDNITGLIPIDFGGGSSLSKTYLMAYLILRNHLKSYVEIGVHRGRSLFPAAYAIKQNNGISYGIDPYNKDIAREYDVEENFQKQIDEFIDELDVESVYQDVMNLRSELGFENHLELIREKSSDSAEFFRKNDIKIDMLHIDGNHDTKYVMEDVELYLPLLKPDSIIVMDDIDWDSVKPAYDKLKETATVIFESTIFAILINSKIEKDMVKKYEFELYNTFNIIEGFIEQKLLIDKKNFTINGLESHINNLESHINNLELDIGNIRDELLSKNEEIVDLELDITNIHDELLSKNKEIVDLESDIRTLANSRKADLYRNFQTLFSRYPINRSVPKKSKSAYLSNIPYLFILLKSKGNIKNALVNIRGYRAIKRLGIFNEHHYLNKYKNILISGMNPLIHYMYYGHKENKHPHGIFDVKYYLNEYGDVKKSGMNPLVHYSLYGINEGKKMNNIEVSVIVTSYNHEKYIRDCIDSILMQKGVDFELIIGDDFSQDNTRKILEEYQKQYPEIINLLPSTENLGVTKNLKRCLKEATGDYIAICEGDDYWIDPYKLQKQVNFLEERQDCVICFNSVLTLYEDKDKQNYLIHRNLAKNTFTIRELALGNFIGNFSCCMYRTKVVKKLSDTLYDFFTVDWMFNMACSEYGKIGFLNEVMSVYRIHSRGVWSSKDSNDQALDILKNIDIYDEFLSFKYEYEFKEVKERVLSSLSDNIYD